MAVTRADVARLAGVSPALVSYVLNDGPRPVSAAARERIERAIAELDYRPNTIAQALRGAGTRTIGLLLPSAVNRFFGELATAIEDQLFATGHILTVGITSDEHARESAYIETLLDRRVDAVLIVSSHASSVLDLLRDSGTPALVLDRVPGDVADCSATVDNVAGAVEAVEHLIVAHGHTSIGCLGGRLGTTSADDRVEGWMRALARHGLDEVCVTRRDFNEEGGYRGAMDLLADPTARPGALFVSSDIQSIGALSACAELGIAVPGDLAVVSFDGTPTATYAVPSFTSYKQPIRDLAARAVECVLRAIADPSAEPQHVVLPGELVIGTSCGCGA